MAQAPFRSILVPLDGSPFAEQALPWASETARRAGAMMQLALVHHPAPALATALEMPEIGAQLDEEARAREQSYLTAQVDRVRAGWNVPVTSVLLNGGVAEALQHQAEASGADLVVLTTHGRGLVSRFWLGSIADQLMRRLHLPLLFVRPGESSAGVPQVRRILVTLDGSLFAEEALGAAQAFAGAFGAEIVLLLVIEPPVPVADPAGLMVIPVTVDAEKRLRESAAAYLGTVTSRLAAEGIRVTSAAVEGATVAGAVLAQVEAQGIDLLVVASHGAGGFERLVIGSVADKLVRGARIPVLVVRPETVAGPPR
ncbi:MAG: universal stress protein [Gemmatimonadota bacterium]|nr:universal stress protein [Gemmatimonadota bacterium]